MAAIKLDLWIEIPDQMATDFKEADHLKRSRILATILESGRHCSMGEPIIVMDEEGNLPDGT